MEPKQDYYMRQNTVTRGVYPLTETEAEQLRAKGWMVVPKSCVDPERSGHLHLVDSHGNFVGTRVLDPVQAGDLVRQGYRLVHVGDATPKDLADMRTAPVEP